MSLQRRSFFSLKCNPPDCAVISAPPEISLCGGTPFTLGTRFYLPAREADATIIAQEGVFSLSIVNGAVRFFSKGLGTFTLDAAKYPIEEKEWNRVDVVYDGTEVTIYLYGLPTLSGNASSSKSSFVDKGTPWKMGLMEGYLQSVELYSQALDGDNVRKLFFGNGNVSKDKIELWADFGEYEPLDRSSHKHSMQLKGGCDIVNLVYGITPGKSGCIVPMGTPPVNPGSGDCPAFTVLAKVYPDIMTDEGDTYIFCNGTAGKAGSVCLGLSNKQARPFLSLGEKNISFDKDVDAQKWVDLAATVSGTSVALYIDGTPAGTGTLSSSFSRTEAAEIYMGNCQQGGAFVNGLRGHMDSICIFSSALPAGKLKGYSDVAPYYFDAGLKAMWLFSQEGRAAEITQGRQVAISGTEASLLENTVLDRELPSLEFAMPDKETGFTKMEKWQNRLTAEIFLQTMSSITGLEATNGFKDKDRNELNGSMALQVRANLASDPHVSKIITRNKPDKKDILETAIPIFSLCAIGVPPIVAGFYSAFLGHNQLGITFFFRRFGRAAEQYCETDKYKATAIGAGILFLCTRTSGKIDHFEKMHRPSGSGGSGTSSGSDPSEPSGTKECRLKIASIAFYDEALADAGALCGRPDFDHDPVLPEWSSSRTENAPALYHNKGTGTENLSIKVIFHCDKLTKEETTVTVGTREAEDSILGSIPETEFTVRESGDYTVELPLKNNTLSEAQPKCHTQQWEWYFKIKEETKLYSPTEHKIYVLAGNPLYPWTTEKGSANLPVYPMIDVCNEIAEKECTETAEARKFSSRFVDWFGSCGKFATRKWNDNPRYTRWSRYHRILTVDGKALLAAIRKYEKDKSKVAVNDLDTACFQCLLARLEGLEDVRILELCAGHGVSGLLLRGGKGPDGTVLEEGARETYSVCGIYPAKSKLPEIWDAFLQLKGTDDKWLSVKGIPFGTGDRKTDCVGAKDNRQYRSLLCMQFCTCQVGLAVKTIKMDTLPLTRIKMGDPVLGIISGRTDFDESVIKEIPLEPHKVRCHAISYESIQRAIVFSINAANGPNPIIDGETCCKMLEALRIAVSGMEDPGTSEDMNEQNANLTVDYLHENYCEKFPLYSGKEAEQLAQSLEFRQEVAEICQYLLYNLNSCKFNLRSAMSDWNSSIGKHMDLNGWIHVTDNETQYYSDCACDDIETKEKSLEETNWGDYPDPIGAGFYITGVDNMVRLCYLYEFLNLIPKTKVQATEQNPFTIRMGCIIDFDQFFNPEEEEYYSDLRRRIIYSSDNDWNLRDYARDDRELLKEPIYFPAEVDGQTQWIKWPNEDYIKDLGSTSSGGSSTGGEL